MQLIPGVEAVGKPHFDNHPISETIYGVDERSPQKVAAQRERRVVGLGKRSQGVATASPSVMCLIVGRLRTAHLRVFLQAR